MATNDIDKLNENTIALYINLLRRIFVVEELPAWSPNLRSKTAIRTTDTRHFVDPSIAVAALGIGPKDLLNDLNTFGLFLNLCAFVIFAFLQMLWMVMFIIIATRTDLNVMRLFICERGLMG